MPPNGAQDGPKMEPRGQKDPSRTLLKTTLKNRHEKDTKKTQKKLSQQGNGKRVQKRSTAETCSNTYGISKEYLRNTSGIPEEYLRNI